jgi:hypothetical protein
MSEMIDAAAANAEPPSDFDVFEPEVVVHLLGRTPPAPLAVNGWHRPRNFRVEYPDAWPEDLEGAKFLYRGLARLLWERGGTTDAADSIRRDLQAGRLAAIVALPHGALSNLEPHRFRGDESRRLWWMGRADVLVTTGTPIGRFEGDVYLIESKHGAAEPGPGTPKPLDLNNSEALCKLILHLVGKKSAAQIAHTSTGTDYAVPERTVSDLIKKARDRLAEKRK